MTMHGTQHVKAQKWAGARWWKFDFHTHTPASDDYGKGPNQATLKERSPRDWLFDFMSAGVDCVVVADHNSGAWIDRLKDALKSLKTDEPEEYRPITIFPGVEISVNGGVHVLAVLDPSAGTSEIDSLLGAVGYSGTKGASGNADQLSVTIRNRSGICRGISEICN